MSAADEIELPTAAQRAPSSSDLSSRHAHSPASDFTRHRAPAPAAGTQAAHAAPSSSLGAASGTVPPTVVVEEPGLESLPAAMVSQRMRSRVDVLARTPLPALEVTEVAAARHSALRAMMTRPFAARYGANAKVPFRWQVLKRPRVAGLLLGLAFLVGFSMTTLEEGNPKVQRCVAHVRARHGTWRASPAARSRCAPLLAITDRLGFTPPPRPAPAAAAPRASPA